MRPGRGASARLSPSLARGEDALRQAVSLARRTAPGPALVRLLVLLSGVLALVVALPAPLRDSPWTYLLVVGLSVTPVVWPGSPWVTAVELTIAGTWLVRALLYHEQFSLSAALAVTVLLYLHHSAGTLAAAVPLTANVAPAVLLGWLGRAGAVLLASLVLLGVLAVVLPGPEQEWSAVAVPLVGLLAATGAALTIVFLLHRRR